MKILLIVATPDDLLKVATTIPNIPQINVGNYGRIAPKQGTEIRKSYDTNLYAYPNEVEILQKVVATGIPCNMQVTPETPPQELGKLLGK